MATYISPALDDEVRRYVNDEITSEEYFRLVEERFARERAQSTGCD